MKSWPVRELANEAACLLFLWSTNPHLDQAIEIGKAWGFSFVTVAFVWNKGVTNPGHYTMSECEMCLLFKMGKIPSPRGKRNIKQYFEERRKNHSEKPDEFANRIDQMFPTKKKIELFARKQRPHWTVWGDEITK